MKHIKIGVIILTNTADDKREKLLYNTISTLQNAIRFVNNDNCIDYSVSADFSIVESHPDSNKSWNVFESLLIGGSYDMMVYTAPPFNYNKSINFGLRSLVDIKRYDYILILNNDLEFKEDSIEKFLISAEKAKDNNIDSFSLYTENWWTHQRDFKNNTNSIIEGNKRSWHLCGWNIIVRPSVLQKIGEFDERFEFFCQDDDYREELIRHKIKHALIRNAVISHQTSSSHDLLEDRERMTNGMINVFYKKWGKYPD
jgi:cellulose synthase/poly-beta-1,6-N-acetylglucosamine synthase-like glycosyltransferase